MANLKGIQQLGQVSPSPYHIIAHHELHVNSCTDVLVHPFDSDGPKDLSM